MSSPFILVDLLPQLFNLVGVIVPFPQSIGWACALQHLVDLFILAIDFVFFVSLHSLASTLQVCASLFNNCTLCDDFVFSLLKSGICLWLTFTIESIFVRRFSLFWSINSCLVLLDIFILTFSSHMGLENALFSEKISFELMLPLDLMHKTIKSNVRQYMIGQGHHW